MPLNKDVLQGEDEQDNPPLSRPRQRILEQKDGKLNPSRRGKERNKLYKASKNNFLNQTEN